MNELIFIALGVACAAIGGDLFVRGVVGLGHWARISPGIVGATLAAFATSSPELSVALHSATAGRPEIALGNALGANVVNISLILAIALVLTSMRSTREAIRREYIVALLAPLLTGLLILDGELSAFDALLLLLLFVVWLAKAANKAKEQRIEPATDGTRNRQWPVVLYCLSGLVLLIAAGHFFVSGASGLAAQFGIDEFIIGATLVALGTTIPELATTLIARLRGHDEVGLGALLGSNIFNGLFIVPLAASIHPITVAWYEAVPALIFGLVSVALVLPGRNGMINRWRGLLLLMLLLAYFAVLGAGAI